MITEALKKQYALVRQARELVFTFMETAVGEGLKTPVPAYQNQDIRHLLVHNADCYLYWLAYMALEQTVEWLNDKDYNNMADIRRLYTKTDDLMAVFLQQFKNSIDIPITNSRCREDKLNASPLMIFTHVTTHEFHHKGQIVSMCRQLGYLPPETDVYRAFY
jgi:uncharacterized damage-inducible protein DinB